MYDFPWPEADAMLLALLRRIRDIGDCRDGSAEREELDCITNAAESYQAKRWPQKVMAS
jgi:hypothetical protein